MQNKKASKILSIFSAAALLVTQLAVTLPASAAEEDTSSAVTFTDDFESRDTLITNGTSGISIVEGAGKNGGKAMVIDLANKSGTNINYVPQDADGSRLLIEANTSYKFIVTMTYKMTAENNKYSPLYMKTQLVNSSNGWLGVFASNFHLGDVIWSSRVPYSSQLGGYCGPTSDGDWHTVSFPISGTGNANSNGYIVHYFDNLGSTGEFVIDEISYTCVDTGAELSTVKFNSKGDDYCDYMTVVTGTNTSELPVPTKEGYKFAGWYTDENCTVKCDTVPSNDQSQTESGTTTENVYVNLYARWSFDPYVAVYDDFERDDVEGRVVQILNDTYDGTSNPIYQDEENLGVNDSKALIYAKDFSGSINTNVILKNKDGSTFDVKSGDVLNLIVKFSYNSTDDDFLWNTPYLIPTVISGSEGSYQFTKLTSLTIAHSWASFDTSKYQAHKSANGGWHTVSYPVKGTVGNDGVLSLGIETNQQGTLFIDNVEITVLPSDMSATALVMTDSMTSTVNRDFVTAVAGSDISVLATPVKEGYNFTGWYSDAECTQKLTTVPELADGAKYATIYSGWERVTVFTDDFESRDSLITNATAGVSIVEGAGKNGGKAMVIDLANKSGTNINYVPQDADGSRLLIEANTSYKFIVTMTYKMTAENNKYSPLYMKTQLVNSSNGWLGVFASNFHLGDVIWSSRVPYSSQLGGYCGPTSDGDWHTVSFPISGTGNANSNGYIVHYFDNLDSTGEFVIDEITYRSVGTDTELSTVKFVTNGGSELDYTTVLTGTSTTEFPTPTKEGYEFAGWYTDEACTVKCDTVPSNDQSQTENDTTTENVYVNLYAGWTAASFDANNDGFINIIDLVSMKKSIANNESKYNSDNLVELRKVLLSGIETVKATDKNNYVLTVDEEFDGDALNTDLWNLEENNEDVTVENGLAVFGKNGSAGGIDGSYKLQYKYGYIEARVKLPETTGVSSAFWLNQTYASTRRFSEIDIFETFGQANVVSNIHKWDNNNKKESYATTEEELAFHTDWNANVLSSADRIARTKSVDTSVFHTVACEWGEDFVRFYLDGEKYFEVNADKYPDAIEIIKASPLFVVLSASPESATLTGTSADWMQVDYVRIYQNAAESTLIK